MAISKERVAVALRWQALLAAAAISLEPVGAQTLGVSAASQTGTASDSPATTATRLDNSVSAATGQMQTQGKDTGGGLSARRASGLGA